MSDNLSPDTESSTMRINQSQVEVVTVNRYLTFLCGIAFTCVVYWIFYWVLSRWLNFDLWMRLGLFFILFVFCFIGGLVKVAGKQLPNATPGNKKDRSGGNIEKDGADIEAGFKGIVKVFDAPLPHAIQFLLPTGDNWLPPLFVKTKAIDMREQAIDIPPDQSDAGFGIDSISLVNPADASEGVKFVPMIVKARIRIIVTEPYKFYSQDEATIERTLVSFVVETLRHLATNGNYPGTRNLPIKDDFELMQKKDELSRALTEDIKTVSKDSWGLDVIGVVIRQLKPADDTLVKRYEQIAMEIADRGAQTIEGNHILNLAMKYQAKDPELKWSEALMYAFVSAGKTTLENLKILGGKDALIFKGDKNLPPSSPSPS